MLRLPVPSPYESRHANGIHFHKIATLYHKSLYHSTRIKRGAKRYRWNFVFLYPIGILDT